MSIKQSSEQSPSRKADLPPVCWHRDRRRDCLRIEASADEAFFFPYQQLVVAHHHRSDTGETLRISFSNHEVILSGRHLAEIATALQDFSVDWVKATPVRYKGLAEPDAASIVEIEVKALE